MHYIGVDYHKHYSYVVVKDKEGKVEQRGTVNNSKEKFQQFLQPYQPEKRFWKRREIGGLSTTGWKRFWMV